MVLLPSSSILLGRVITGVRSRLRVPNGESAVLDREKRGAQNSGEGGDR